MTDMRFSFDRVRGILLLLTVVTASTAPGCQSSGSRQSTAPTQLDRLMQAYPDLQGGRFLVIADFEDPRHMELFKLIGVSGQGKCASGRKTGGAATGAGCMLFTAGSPDDVVVINNTSATHWYLTRNWRPYDLLLLSVESPVQNLALEMTIAGGPLEARRAAHASIPLQRGWNVVRLDLAEIGERIPLDNVQEVRLAVSGASRPVQLSFDDVLLTGFRRDLFGDSSNRDAGLYVRQVGRRWRIGAARPGADFELTFGNGQIVEWYNIAADPHRLHSLVRGAAMGPMPVVVGSSDRLALDTAQRDGALAVRSRILEMNAVRTVVACDWRLAGGVEPAADAQEQPSLRRWTYTIYPTGQMYVAVEATALREGQPGSTTPPLGLAMTLSASPEDELQVNVSAEQAEPGPTRRPAYITARNSASDALLLYVVDDAGGAIRVSESELNDGMAPEESEYRSLLATREMREGSVETWACHVLLGSSSKISGKEALARAIDFAGREPPRLEVGSWVPVGDGGTGESGFDPASGCYRVAADKGRVRLVIDGRQHPYFSPAFQIINTSGSEAWVYVDDRILDTTARDAHGNLIFQLPGTIHKPTTVEVLSHR